MPQFVLKEIFVWVENSIGNILWHVNLINLNIKKIRCNQNWPINVLVYTNEVNQNVMDSHFRISLFA